MGVYIGIEFFKMVKLSVINCHTGDMVCFVLHSGPQAYVSKVFSDILIFSTSQSLIY